MLNHQGISLICDGIASLAVNAKSVGRIEALYNSVKPVGLFSYAAEVEKAGRFVLHWY